MVEAKARRVTITHIMDANVFANIRAVLYINIEVSERKTHCIINTPVFEPVI